MVLEAKADLIPLGQGLSMHREAASEEPEVTPLHQALEGQEFGLKRLSPQRQVIRYHSKEHLLVEWNLQHQNQFLHHRN